MSPTRNDALAAQVDGLRAIALRLLDGLEGGHTNALYGPCRDLLSSVAERAVALDTQIREECADAVVESLREFKRLGRQTEFDEYDIRDAIRSSVEKAPTPTRSTK